MASVGVLTLYRSTVGKKIVMAVSGLMLLGFVAFHLYGNLKVYQGPEVYNAYAEGLRTIGSPIFGHEHLLWLARIGLIVAFFAHIIAAIQVSRQNLSGRAIAYNKKKNIHTTYAAVTMRWGGLVIALFVIYHLLHLTFGVLLPGFRAGDVYGNFVAGFSYWPVSLFYILANIALGLHIYHGGWSAWQTLGLNNYRWDGVFKAFAVVFALAITIGNVSFPLSVLTGVVR